MGSGELHPQRLDQLGVVTAERLLIAALDEEFVCITPAPSHFRSVRGGEHEFESAFLPRRVRCELEVAGSAADFRQANSPRSLLTISFFSYPTYDQQPLTTLMSRFLRKKIRWWSGG
jgi:hypothetical protein